ncbi:hypothetical protein QFZ60_000855 [Arthrobacter sp. B2I5]|nr:hypothetical protein [Arthrobacter sp. B2I5]
MMIMVVPRSCPSPTISMISPPAGPSGTTACFQLASRACFRSRMPAAHTISESLANSDGCAVKPPTLSQFRLPFTDMPSGVNTSTRATREPISSGQPSHRIRRTGIRASTSMITTPATVHMACLSGRSYGLFPAATDSTDDADATSTSPIAESVRTTARIRGRRRPGESSSSHNASLPSPRRAGRPVTRCFCPVFICPFLNLHSRASPMAGPITGAGTAEKKEYALCRSTHGAARWRGCRSWGISSLGL